MWAMIVAGQILGTFKGQGDCLGAALGYGQGAQCVYDARLAQQQPTGPLVCTTAMPGIIVCPKQ